MAGIPTVRDLLDLANVTQSVLQQMNETSHEQQQVLLQRRLQWWNEGVKWSTLLHDIFDNDKARKVQQQ